jgi:tetraether lipid synthase
MVFTKTLEALITQAANVAWTVSTAVIRRTPTASFRPRWASAAMPKSWEKSRPVLGWPRTTDSLCPVCVKEARAQILRGADDVEIMRSSKVGEIKATILERNGSIEIEKTCPVHGTFIDTLAIDAAFQRRIEGLFPGRDMPALTDRLHNHGSSSIKWGRGSVLTIDLTNRCNMMCDPCFMDANQVGYVHELTLPEVKQLLDDALTIKPKRQMSVQFSGGEPTLSPIFLESVAYARAVGYYSVQAATNGIRFAQDPDFTQAARKAGLRIAYLQFDGIGEHANSHRKVGNLFDVKLHAIENLSRAGIDVALVATIVNTVNNDQIGSIIKFAVENSEKISFVSFQPVSFTGRDEDIDDESRMRRRYTLSHLAKDVKAQTGAFEPLRDWFPLSAAGAFADVTDLIQGPAAEWGTMKCGCHPNCGIGAALFVSKQTKEWAPLTQFLNADGLIRDAKQIVDFGRGPAMTKTLTALSLLRNYRTLRAPRGLTLRSLVRKFDKQTGGALGGRIGAPKDGDRKNDEWLMMFIAGMWFQDLWTYDFRRTEMCIIPYATQMGEISFCAYNTGVGWRQVVEKMYQNATVAEWYKAHGKHGVYSNPKQGVPLGNQPPPSLRMPTTTLIPIEKLRRPRPAAVIPQATSSTQTS